MRRGMRPKCASLCAAPGHGTSKRPARPLPTRRRRPPRTRRAGTAFILPTPRGGIFPTPCSTAGSNGAFMRYTRFCTKAGPGFLLYRRTEFRTTRPCWVFLSAGMHAQRTLQTWSRRTAWRSSCFVFSGRTAGSIRGIRIIPPSSTLQNPSWSLSGHSWPAPKTPAFRPKTGRCGAGGPSGIWRRCTAPWSTLSGWTGIFKRRALPRPATKTGRIHARPHS